MILLGEHDEPSLAVQQKRRCGPSASLTSTPKNRVWGIENYPSGRSCSSPDLSRENATRSVQFSYEIVSGRIEHYQYDPFGNVITQTGSLQQPFQWSSKETHTSTGLVYYGYRFYSPSSGRWLSRDPSGEKGGFNLYSFADDSPSDHIDTDGLRTQTMPLPTATGLPVGNPVVPPPGGANPGRNYNTNTLPNWDNPQVQQMYQMRPSQGASKICHDLAMSAPGQNQVFYSTNVSVGRATGAFAVIWGKQGGGQDAGANVNPPGYKAATAYRGGSVEKGHLIGSQFGGDGQLHNIVTMAAGGAFNSGPYRTAFENQILNALKPNGSECFVCAFSLPVYGTSKTRGSLPVAAGFVTTIIGDNTYLGSQPMQPKITGDLYYDDPPWNGMAVDGGWLSQFRSFNPNQGPVVLNYP